MGGTEISTTLENTTPETLQENYRKLYEQALYDHGHSGYSGSFAEKPDVEIRKPPIDKKYWDLEKAKEDSQDNDKWGPSWAYQLDKDTFWLGGSASS